MTKSMTYATILAMNDLEKIMDKSMEHKGGEPHLLREIIRTYQVLMAGFSRHMGMPASRFVLMRLLANAPQGAGVMDLSRLLGVNAAGVTRQIKEMEAEGLVLRHGDPKDGRRSYVQLSPAGWAVFEKIHKQGHEMEEALASVIGADDMRKAAEVLSTMRLIIESLMASERNQP